MYKLEMGTSDLANDLDNSISAQQFVIKRDTQARAESQSDSLNPDQRDGSSNQDDESETSSLPADEALDEVFNSPVPISVPKRTLPVRPAPARPSPPAIVTNAWSEEASEDQPTTDSGKKYIDRNLKNSFFGAKKFKTIFL